MSEQLKTRLRMVAVAGLLAPAAMALVGFGIHYIVLGEHLPLSWFPNVRAVLLGVLTAALSMGLVVVLYKSSKTFEEALKHSGVRVGEDALKVLGYPGMIVIVVMAGIGEEILFRGGLQPAIGLVPAALLFGFSHGGWRKGMWAYVVAAALSGLLYGLVYAMTGNLWVTIIAHAVHNVLSTVLIGKKVDFRWEGLLPTVRLLPEEEPVVEAAVSEAEVPAEEESPGSAENPDESNKSVG